jgi:hypothetical protein
VRCGFTLDLVPVYYHRTSASAAILRGGFADGEGSYMFTESWLVGVFVSDVPLDINEGALGDDLLELTLPDDVDLDEFELVAEDQGSQKHREWCVPAELLNRRASVRLLSQEEQDVIGDELWLRFRGGPDEGRQASP